jgi:signal peptidase II
MPHVFHFALRRLFLITFLFMTTIGCDQATKAVARDTLRFRAPLSYLGDSVRLEFAQNPGAFLNLGAGLGAGLRFWIFTVAVGSALLFAAFMLLRRSSSALVTAGFTLIIAGGAGNLIDRLAFGSVTDFLNVGLGGLRTGIFNVADMAVMAGGALLLLTHFERRARE